MTGGSPTQTLLISDLSTNIESILKGLGDSNRAILSMGLGEWERSEKLDGIMGYLGVKGPHGYNPMT